MNSSQKEQPQSVSQARRGVGGRGRKSLSGFAGALLKEWERLALPVRDERVVVAVSGGADSVALVLALDELMRGGRLELEVKVAHLEHGLRGEAGREDARWVGELAGGLKFEVVIGRVDVRERAERTGDNLEQAARRARYEFLAAVAAGCGAHVVVTGHTMDDQAETVLLRLLRGSGAEGLGGMEPVRALDDAADVLLARPLLGWTRRVETEEYCREREVQFRMDAMNEDEEFARVRVRRQLLPLMETFNPRVVESLSRMAELLRGDREVLDAAAGELLKAAKGVEGFAKLEGEASVKGALRVDVLQGAPAAVRRRALRLWIAEGRGDLRRLELVHLLGVERLLAEGRGGRVAELPGGSFVERRRGSIFLHVK